MKPFLLTTEEQNLVREWTLKYEDFVGFVFDAILESSVPASWEELYSYYRGCLVDDESNILPYWQFYKTWEQEYFVKHNTQDMDYGFDPNTQHPLNYFYEPENLYQLAARLNLKEIAQKWKSDQSGKEDAFNTMTQSVLRVHRFCQWAYHDEICMQIHWRQEVKIGSYNILASSFEALVFGTDKFNHKIDIAPVPDLGVYLAKEWENQETSYAKTVVDWPDGRMIDIHVLKKTIESIVSSLKSGKRVEVACLGGHGRTGTVLACLLVELEHLEHKIAIKTLRDRYCELAVETPEQENLVAEFNKTS